jgi:hypothetical protein
MTLVQSLVVINIDIVLVVIALWVYYFNVVRKTVNSRLSILIGTILETLFTAMTCLISFAVIYGLSNYQITEEYDWIKAPSIAFLIVD